MAKWFLWVVMLIFLASCANKPDLPNTTMQIEKVITTLGNPIDFDLSQNTIFVAEDQVGFSLYNRTTGSQMFHQNNEYGNFWTQITLVRYYEPLNIILVYDRTTSNNIFHLYKYNEADLTVTECPSPPASNTNNIRDIVFENTPLNEQQFRTFYGFYGYGTNNINRAYFDISLGTLTSNPAYFATNNPIYNIMLYNDYIIAAMGTIGVTIFDNSLGTSFNCPTLGNARAVAVAGNILFVADYNEGVSLVDISNITQPTLLGKKIDVSGRATTIDILDNNLVVGSNNGGGVYIFDIADPTNPVELAHLTREKIGTTINKVKFYAGKLYIASREKGIICVML